MRRPAPGHWATNWSCKSRRFPLIRLRAKGIAASPACCAIGVAAGAAGAGGPAWLSEISGVSGFERPGGEVDRRALRSYLRAIAARGLYFLDEGGLLQGLMLMAAREAGLAAAPALVVVDAAAQPWAIDGALAPAA